jgi:hypothetical protein
MHLTRRGAHLTLVEGALVTPLADVSAGYAIKRIVVQWNVTVRDTTMRRLPKHLGFFGSVLRFRFRLSGFHSRLIQISVPTIWHT